MGIAAAAIFLKRHASGTADRCRYGTKIAHSGLPAGQNVTNYVLDSRRIIIWGGLIIRCGFTSADDPNGNDEANNIALPAQKISNAE